MPAREKLKKPLLLIGGGGHARVLIDALKLSGCNIIGITDADAKKSGSSLEGIAIIGDDSILSRYAPDDILLVNAIGSVKGTEERRKIFVKFKNQGFIFASVVHPSAIISRNVALGEGVQIMAGAVIQTGCFIGDNTLINTRVSVDHDSKIGKNVHLAPGVIISGEVEIDDNVFIGSGSTVIQGVRIGKGSIVGAASLVIKNNSPHTTVFGVPAKVVS